jgi:hypothetical protein
LGGLLGRAQIDYFVSGVTLLSEGQHVALDIPEFVKFAISALCILSPLSESRGDDMHP